MILVFILLGFTVCMGFGFWNYSRGWDVGAELTFELIREGLDSLPTVDADLDGLGKVYVEDIISLLDRLEKRERP